MAVAAGRENDEALITASGAMPVTPKPFVSPPISPRTAHR
jgi:hypothetical protein